MVTNGDRKTNIFGKLVPPSKSWSFFKSWFSARAARSGWRPRGRRSATAVQDAGREQGRARRLGSDAFGHEGAQISNVDGSVVKRVQPCQAEKGKSTSRSQSTVRHVYKSNYEMKDVRLLESDYKFAHNRDESISRLDLELRGRIGHAVQLVDGVHDH